MSPSQHRPSPSTRWFPPKHWGPAVSALFLASLGWSAPAAAQVTGDLSVQRFDLAPGEQNFLSTRGVRMDGKMIFTGGVMANYGYRPFSIVYCSSLPCSAAKSQVTYRVVENLVTADLHGALTLTPELQLAVKLPVTYAKGQGIVDADNDGVPDGISAVGLGDVQVEVKGRFYGSVQSPVALGAYAWLALPTGHMSAAGSFIGNQSVSLGGALVADVRLGELSLGANLGGMWRNSVDVGTGTQLGAEARYAVAAAYQLGPMVRVVADMFGSSNFSTALGANSLELDGGAQVLPLGSSWTFTAGAGAGIAQGIGTPNVRAFLGLLYNSRSKDRDSDGLRDSEDACPDDAEDFDGFEDSDGCPETDNDGDSLADAVDKCPLQSEDFDGFEDADGCPDLDNDKDGYEDAVDQCPLEPETVNGFQDADGCPDVKDTDHDGVFDDKDRCPEEPEDTDGYQDEDGCPDPDNDLDGVPDSSDECIDEKEDGRGKGAETRDGCPYDS